MAGPEVLDVARDAILTLVFVSAPLMIILGLKQQSFCTIPFGRISSIPIRQ